MPSHNGDDDNDDAAPLHIQRASVTGAAAPVPLEVTDVIAHLFFVSGIVHVRNIGLRENSSLCTTPEVLACYSASLAALATHGDNGAWARFTIISSLQLRAPLGDSSRMLVLTVYFSVSGVGEWLDNDGRDNFRLPEKAH